jgi:hypothetical protein
MIAIVAATIPIQFNDDGFISSRISFIPLSGANRTRYARTGLDIFFTESSPKYSYPKFKLLQM